MTLRELRESRGLTQQQVAAVAGINQGHVSLLESGKLTRPEYRTVAAVAKALNADVETVYQAIQEAAA